MTERVEVEVDAATARWLRGCAHQRGSTVASLAASQLRDLALAESARASEGWFTENHPTYFDDMTAEIEAAFTEAADG